MKARDGELGIKMKLKETERLRAEKMRVDSEIEVQTGRGMIGPIDDDMIE